MDAGQVAAHLQPFSDREAVPEWARAAVAQDRRRRDHRRPRWRPGACAPALPAPKRLSCCAAWWISYNLLKIRISFIPSLSCLQDKNCLYARLMPGCRMPGLRLFAGRNRGKVYAGARYKHRQRWQSYWWQILLRGGCHHGCYRPALFAYWLRYFSPGSSGGLPAGAGECRQEAITLSIRALAAPRVQEQPVLERYYRALRHRSPCPYRPGCSGGGVTKKIWLSFSRRRRAGALSARGSAW